MIGRVYRMFDGNANTKSKIRNRKPRNPRRCL